MKLNWLATFGLALATSASSAATFNVGDVFASTGSGKVKVYSNTGTLKATLDTGLGGFTTGSTFDASGNFYVTAFQTGKIAKFDSIGALTTASWSSGYASPESLVFNAAGDAYIGTAQAAKIYKVNSSGAALSNWSVNTNTDWIDLAADQKTVLYSNESNTMYTLDTTTGVSSIFVTGAYGQLFAKRYRPNGEVMVASSTGNAYRFGAAGTLLQTYASGIESVFALNLDPDGTSFWTGSTGGQTVKRIDIASGATLASWSTGTGTLFGLSVLGEVQAGGGGVVVIGNPIPEPQTYALMLMGLGVLGFVVRRRHSQKT